MNTDPRIAATGVLAELDVTGDGVLSKDDIPPGMSEMVWVWASSKIWALVLVILVCVAMLVGGLVGLRMTDDVELRALFGGLAGCGVSFVVWLMKRLYTAHRSHAPTTRALKKQVRESDLY